MEQNNSSKTLLETTHEEIHNGYETILAGLLKDFVKDAKEHIANMSDEDKKRVELKEEIECNIEEMQSDLSNLIRALHNQDPNEAEEIFDNLKMCFECAVSSVRELDELDAY